MLFKIVLWKNLTVMYFCRVWKCF